MAKVIETVVTKCSECGMEERVYKWSCGCIGVGYTGGTTLACDGKKHQKFFQSTKRTNFRCDQNGSSDNHTDAKKSRGIISKITAMIRR